MWACVCVIEMGRRGGGAGLIHQGQLSWLQVQAYSFQHCTFKSPTCTHTHMHCSATGQGWVGLGRGTVVECLSSHAPQTSLWPALPLLARSVFAPVSGHCFFHRSPHCCEGHECKCCGEGIEPHSGDEVWARLVLLSPDGRVQNGDCRTSWYNGGI